MENNNNYLFDTTVFIDYWRGSHNAKNILFQVKENNIHGSYSIITEVELWVGVKDEASEKDHLKMLSPLTRMEITANIAHRAGRFRREYQINLIDALLAASAEEYNLILITRNEQHFQRLAEEKIIKLQGYSK